MSDARAIEAVTETLRGIIDVGVKQVEASAVAVARPPDRVGDTNQEMQVNLFLFQAAIDPSLRNQPPDTFMPGESGQPALPLVLHYLLSSYASDGNDLDAHRMLGGALLALHDHPILSRADLAALAPYSNVSQQVERVRITWQGLEEKDIFSLWSVFQSPYRVSTAFEARVVLIDSARAGATPLPVLRRGADDRGPAARADTSLPFPSLLAATPPNGQPAAYAGDVVHLSGATLPAGNPAPNIAILLRHPLLADPVRVEPPQLTPVSATELTFAVPPAPSDLPAGTWSVALAYTAAPEPELSTNDVSLAIGPVITTALPLTVARTGGGGVTISLSCWPPVRPGQPAALLLGGRPHPAQPITAPATDLEFRITTIAAGDYPVRLRVAGIDSDLIDRTSVPAQLRPAMTVTVT